MIDRYSASAGLTGADSVLRQVVEAFHVLLWCIMVFSAERLGSGDGERKTPLTRQIAFEPLPASVLFGVHGWGPGYRRIHRSPAAIMTTATTPVGKIHFVMLPAVRDKYTSTLSPHRVVNQENQRGGVCFISLDSQVTLFLGRTSSASTAGMEARIQRRTLPAVGWSVLLAILF